MGAKNSVIVGDYKGWSVKTKSGVVTISKPKLLKGGKIEVSLDTVDSYDLIDEESNVSAVSAVGRGVIGAKLLGPAGISAALSAKKEGIHTVGIKFRDGKQSIVEIDNAIYKALKIKLFGNESPTKPGTTTTKSNTSPSAADEIMKYKKLLDEGVITQKEFAAKKKQLLGL